MHFCGIGKDSSLDEKSLTLTSTWWRNMKFPDMTQRTFIAFLIYGSESRDEGEGEFSSLNLDIPYQDGCSQFLISSNKIYSSICDWKNFFFHFLSEKLLPLRGVFLSRYPIRVSFPTPQCQLSLCYSFKFHPCTVRIQGTNSEKDFLSKFWWILDGFSQKCGNSQSMNQTECLIIWKDCQNVFRMESFHQATDLEYFEDRKSIP